MALEGFPELCDEIKELHIRKNNDYGASWDLTESMIGIPASLSVAVRMTDKISRAFNIIKGEQTPNGFVQMVKDEALEDTIKDLGVYCLIYYLLRKREKAAQNKALIAQVAAKDEHIVVSDS